MELSVFLFGDWDDYFVKPGITQEKPQFLLQDEV